MLVGLSEQRRLALGETKTLGQETLDGDIAAVKSSSVQPQTHWEQHSEMSNSTDAYRNIGLCMTTN